MKAILRSGFLALAIMAFAVAAYAGPYEEIVAANERGDYATALILLRPLAEQGDADARVILGLMHDQGRGVPQDYAKAVKWYRMAANQGHTLAQTALGLRYDQGQGVRQNHAEAVKLWRNAAENDYPLAQFFLGLNYAGEWGDPKTYVQAHMWFSIAAAQGEKAALILLDIAASKMTPDQIADAQRMAREWMAKHQQ